MNRLFVVSKCTPSTKAAGKFIVNINTTITGSIMGLAVETKKNYYFITNAEVAVGTEAQMDLANFEQIKHVVPYVDEETGETRNIENIQLRPKS